MYSNPEESTHNTERVHQTQLQDSAFTDTFIPNNKYVKNVAKGVANTASTVTTLAAKLTFLDRLQNLSLRTQILSGAGISLLLLVVITTITFFSIGKLIRTLQVIKQQSTVVASSHELERLLSDMESSLRGFALSGGNEFLTSYRRSNADFDEKLSIITGVLSDSPQQRKRLDELRSQKITWVKTIAEPAIALQQEIVSGVKTTADMAALVQQGREQSDTMRRLGAEIIAYEEALNSEEASAASIVAIAAQSSTVTFTIIAVGIGLFVLSIIAKNISVPIRDIAKATMDVVRGNLNASVDIRFKNEIGVLARNFNLMVARIGQSVEDLQAEKVSVESKVHEAVRDAETQREYLSKSVDVMLIAIEKFADGDLTVKLDIENSDAIGRLYEGFNRAVGTIREMIHHLAQAVETAAEAATYISTAAEELSAGAVQQASQAQEVAIDVEQMTTSIIDNSRQASSSNDVAQASGIVAQDGSNVVMQTVEKIERIATVVKRSTETVEQLGVSSADIGVIVAEISKIADQTNLLALNAAIEAARAGAQGRGFAVVADEVGKLAERTARATKEIEIIVKKIQGETKNAVKAMNLGNSEVASGIALAHEANNSLEKIVQSSLEVTTMINSIALASERQAATSKHISQSIEMMSVVTTQSAQGVTEIAQSATNLNDLTQRLNELIGRFRLELSTNPSGKSLTSHTTRHRASHSALQKKAGFADKLHGNIAKM